MHMVAIQITKPVTTTAITQSKLIVMIWGQSNNYSEPLVCPLNADQISIPAYPRRSIAKVVNPVNPKRSGNIKSRKILNCASNFVSRLGIL